MSRGAHDAMVARLSSLFAEWLRDRPRYTVVTSRQWQPLEGFPNCIFTFDLLVVDRDARWQGGEGRVVLSPRTPPVTAIDVVTANTLKRDLLDKPGLLNDAGLCEYAIYDPTGEVLRPSLQVFRRRDGMACQVPTGLNGAFFSRLGFQFQFDGDEVLVRSSGPVHLEEELYLLRFPLPGGHWDDSPEAIAKRRGLEERIAECGRREEQ